VSLSERIRVNSEAAPWVVTEIKQLEAECARLRSKIDGLDCTIREGGDTRHCPVDALCLRCERDRLWEAIQAHKDKSVLEKARVFLDLAATDEKLHTVLEVKP